MRPTSAIEITDVLRLFPPSLVGAYYLHQYIGCQTYWGAQTENPVGGVPYLYILIYYVMARDLLLGGGGGVFPKRFLKDPKLRTSVL